MAGKQLNTKILAVRIIPNADPMLLKNLDVRPGIRVSESSPPTATMCPTRRWMKRQRRRMSMWPTRRACTRVLEMPARHLRGEFIGILSGPDPEEVRSGLQAAFSLIENDAHFMRRMRTGTVVYFAHCISRTGSYLSSQAGVPEGTPMAYLIAPPLEASVGLDAALKAADVELSLYYGPPTGDKLCRRTSDGNSGILSGGMRCLRRCGLPDR